jgi:hypothetical protein
MDSTFFMSFCLFVKSILEILFLVMLKSVCVCVCVFFTGELCRPAAHHWYILSTSGRLF